MVRLVHGLHFQNLRGDLYGGVTAAVVALPLALAFGVASGTGAIAGLYGAIFVGFFAALFGGTPSQVSGPTGPMTVIMATLIVEFRDEPALAFTAVILAGLFQVAFGVAGFGRYIALVPYPVISGFMSGIGCIIIILQLAPFIGHPSPKSIITALQAFPGFIAQINPQAALAGLLALGVVYFTPPAIGRMMPPSLLALVTGTGVTWFFLPDAPIIGEVPRGLPLPMLPVLELDKLMIVAEGALVLALLGSIDSLLTSLVADNLTRTNHDSNRELIGQGIGNAVAGLFGGIAGAGATMRTVANIRAGGRTPISGALHAVVLLSLLVGLAPLAEQIPLAVLAGILIKVGIDIIDWRFLQHLYQAPRTEVFVMGVVLVITVFVDLITAVGIGVVLASLLFVKRMADLELANLRIITKPSEETPLSQEESAILQRNPGGIILIHMDGPMSFGSAKNMVRRMEGVAEWGQFKSVVLDLSDVPAIDGTAALAIEDMLRLVQAHRQHLFMVGIQPKVETVLEGLGVLKLVRPGHRFSKRLDALHQAEAISGAKRPEDVLCERVPLKK